MLQVLSVTFCMASLAAWPHLRAKGDKLAGAGAWNTPGAVSPARSRAIGHRPRRGRPRRRAAPCPTCGAVPGKGRPRPRVALSPAYNSSAKGGSSHAMYVHVPTKLLLDQQLPTTAKLTAMVMQLPAARDRSPRTLQALTGLSRHTVLRALAHLHAGGWLTPAPGPSPSPLTTVPADLLTDQRLGAREKLLYVRLRLAQPLGPTSYRTLAALTGLSLNPAKQAIRLLAETGWLHVSQRHQHAPLELALRNPLAQHRASSIAAVRRRLNNAVNKGEALMREFLSLLIASEEFEDDASPGFLINPYTGEEMQLDRYYPPHVAFEYQGAQHFTTTERFPSEEDLRKQQARDYIKRGICEARSIHLITIQAEDLSLEIIRQKVTGLLPLRSLEGQEDLIRFLERAGKAYREKADLPFPVRRGIRSSNPESFA